MSTVKSKKLQVGTDATSSNNFTIYQPATPDGTLRIGVGNADSPTEVGQFNANGYKSVATVPAMKVALASNTSISASTQTKLPFSVIDFDNNNTFDTSNNRWTPGVSGWYLISGTAWFVGINDAKQCQVVLYKNGASYLTSGLDRSSGGSSQIAPTLSAPIYLNSTDYVELYCYQADSGSVNVYSSSQTTWFTGVLIQQT